MKKKTSRQMRLTYFGLLLCLGVLMVVGPALAGTINFVSVSTSQSGGAMYLVSSPGPNFVVVNGNPASAAITNTTIQCISTSVACGQETLTLTGTITGLTAGDQLSIGLDGTWTGGAATTLQWLFAGFPLDTGVQNATASFSFTSGPYTANSGVNINMNAQFIINGLGAGQSIVLPNSAIVNAVTPSAVPEPTSMALMGTGFLAMGIGAWRRRRRQK